MPTHSRTAFDGALLVFAKPVIAGKVKTRLIPALGAQGAADLYQQLHDRVLATAGKAGYAQLQYWHSGDLASAAVGPPWVSLPQRGDNLGERMFNALTTALATHPYAVLIGTDCPSLTRDDLQAAAHSLSADKDAVIGPAEDGGYVLLGVRRVACELFENVEWGTDTVLAGARNAMQALGWSWDELPTRWDVDRPADLRRLNELTIETR